MSGGLPAADTGPDALPAESSPTNTVTATFHVSALHSLWLPAPYRPARVDGRTG